MAKNIRDMVRMYGQEYLAVCGLAKYFPTMNAESSVFFVNGSSGNDSAANFGQTPDTPLLTITKALSLCRTGKNDYIFILDYYQATGETWPIAIAKSQVHIIGITGNAISWPWVQPPGDTAAFTFGSDSAYSETAGLEIGAGASHGCIEFITGGLWGVHIHDCGFGTHNGMTAMCGIRATGGSTPTIGEIINGLIENNRFGAQLTLSGIEVPATFVGPNSVEGTIIRNNTFKVATGNFGINVLCTTANFADGGIFDNVFIVVDEAGAAITFAAGALGMVDGNKAVGLVSNALTAKVFLTGEAGFGWGRNYVNVTAVANEAAYQA